MVDLFPAIPYDTQNQKYWDDQLHFSPSTKFTDDRSKFTPLVKIEDSFTSRGFRKFGLELSIELLGDFTKVDSSSSNPFQTAMTNLASWYLTH